MIEITLADWEKFEDELQVLKNKRIEQNWPSQFLYRGQGDSSWNLKSTLERYGHGKISLKKYHKFISNVKPQIESFTGANWNILSYPEGFDQWIGENDTMMPHAFGSSPEFIATYSYMVYLRHYGFPSPLIDWTSSPYLAAYFAFRHAIRCQKCISIYIFLESTTNQKSGSSNKADIFKFGPYVKTDRRHFLQQSQYTTCIIQETVGNEWIYTPHEEAFSCSDSTQDILWKFNIPASERLKVLRLLDGYNINALSLFGSEESLMETMALREIDFKACNI